MSQPVYGCLTDQSTFIQRITGADSFNKQQNKKKMLNQKSIKGQEIRKIRWRPSKHLYMSKLFKWVACNPQDGSSHKTQNTGVFLVYRILDKCVTRSTLKLECNGQMQGVGFLHKDIQYKEDPLAKWDCKKKRERSFWEEFMILLTLTKHHKYPRKLTQNNSTHGGFICWRWTATHATS